MEKIYFDYASTTPTDPAVVEAMQAYFTQKFGNPSSPHCFGQEAEQAIEDARQVLASFIGAQREEIVFCSGGTEANNHALIGAARQLKSKGNHIIVTSIEHPSVLEPVEYLKEQGFEVSYLKVNEHGQVDVQNFQDLIREQTIIVSVIHANNEIGVIQPIKEIGKITRERNIFFHVDAVQTIGHIPVNVVDLGVDTMSLSAHKFYGPKGVGALYVRNDVSIGAYLMGGDQERKRRSSTQNVPGIVGLAKAIELAEERMEEEIALQKKLRDRLLTEIPQLISGVKINGHLSERLPNNAHFSFEKVLGESLLMSLDMKGIAASMGSACHSGAMEASHVLRAIGLDDDLAFGALRLTIGRWTNEEHINTLLKELPDLVSGLRI